MFDEFLEFNGIGLYPIYRGWMKRPAREDARMLQMDRIARARHWLVTQWNANTRMTLTERVELRQDRMFWRRQGMRLYGVEECTTPKLILPRPHEWSIHLCRDAFALMPEGRLICPRCGYWDGT